MRKRKFKQQIVALYKAGGTSYPQLEREYGINRSTYYKALVCVPSNREKEYEAFSGKVKQAFEESKQRYRAVKICRSLNDNGTPCSLKRVQRHMTVQGLRSVVVKKYNHHANHGMVPDNRENILDRNFKAETINQKWCTDITYIHDDCRTGGRSRKECLHRILSFSIEKRGNLFAYIPRLKRSQEGNL